MKPPLNLFQDIPEAISKEVVVELLKSEPVRIERIVSQGQFSPHGFWYDQKEHEWVTVLSGKAVLQLEGQEKAVTLGPGDTLYLPPHQKHRVEWTDPLQPTVWLTVFWKS